MKTISTWFGMLFFGMTVTNCQSSTPSNTSFQHIPDKSLQTKMDTATFAAGCFWCVEAQFQSLEGVKSVTSGYTGGRTNNPTYRQISTGKTGHAEVIQIVFDSTVLSFDQLLEAFFLAHDPTQLNRQGNDIGEQYRSAVFVHNKEQLEKVRYYMQKMTEEKVYDAPIVTTVEPFHIFYEAEAEHQNYYANNPNEAYCQYVIKPKLEKFNRIFKIK
jgi:peptide-methionine (S)-S-oxide reductase